jgi:hypothetical protein
MHQASWYIRNFIVFDITTKIKAAAAIITAIDARNTTVSTCSLAEASIDSSDTMRNNITDGVRVVIALKSDNIVYRRAGTNFEMYTIKFE